MEEQELAENLFFLFVTMGKGDKKTTGHVDRYVSKRSCIDFSQRLKCGERGRLVRC